MIVNRVEEQELIGKDYSTKVGDVYVCTSFVEDMLYIMGLNKTEYLPGGLAVKNSIGKLERTIQPEAGKNPDPGTYIFYKLYDDGKSGHTGIVSFDNDGKPTMLHNGRNEDKTSENVNIRNDVDIFDDWFRKDKKNPVIYKLITPRR
jgi:hypothetical protein